MSGLRTVMKWAALGLLLAPCAFGALGRKAPKIEIWIRPAKTPASYEEAGRWWGAKHLNARLSPGSTDDQLVDSLVGRDKLDFFWIHSELKEAFKKGYRIGFEGRTADLVLGPHLTAAAARIGDSTSKAFVLVIDTFEKGWAEALRRAVDVFVVLIAEGSQADRERFIESFSAVYGQKYADNQEKLRQRPRQVHVSEGGTTLYLDVRKTIAVMAIPPVPELKTEIYHQTFRVMGDEWGRRLSNNLIRRDDLIDVLRRSKTALQEVPASLETNLCLVKLAFLEAYGTDADSVFEGVAKDADYAADPCAKPAPPAPKPSPTPRVPRR